MLRGRAAEKNRALLDRPSMTMRRSSAIWGALSGSCRLRLTWADWRPAVRLPSDHRAAASRARACWSCSGLRRSGMWEEHGGGCAGWRREAVGPQPGEHGGLVVLVVGGGAVEGVLVHVQGLAVEEGHAVVQGVVGLEVVGPQGEFVGAADAPAEGGGYPGAVGGDLVPGAVGL